MSDRERVIKGLEHCSEGGCKGCPYDQECELADGFTALARDSLELLKEHKAKTGTWQWRIHGKPESGGTLGEAVCDQCGKSTYATAVKGDLNYCPNCGAKMTEGR